MPATMLGRQRGLFLGAGNAPGARGQFALTGGGLFVWDSFSGGPVNTVLSTRSGETGAVWTRHPVGNADVDRLDGVGGVYGNSSSAGLIYYYASGLPPSPDYWVRGTIHQFDTATSYASIRARFDTVLDTCYSWGLNPTAPQWELYRCVNGVNTLLGAYVIGMSTGDDVILELRVKGTQVTALHNGVVRVGPVNDVGGVAPAGRVGISRYNTATGGVSKGLHHMDMQAGTL